MRRIAFVGAALAAVLAGGTAQAADDGSQLDSPFRINYLGYLQNGPKVAVYLAAQGGVGELGA